MVEKELNVFYGMDVPTLSTFLIPILTLTTVWNTGETGDIYGVSCTVFEADNKPLLSCG